MISKFIGIVLLALGVMLGANMPAEAASKAKARGVPAKQLFGHKKSPAKLTPRAVGFYAKGCLAGGVDLPVTGSAWQVMRLSRNRNWAHPELIELIKKLAIDAKAQDGWPGLLVGDLAQPRGGPMLTGHASHQVGLDADIWLTPMPDRVLSKRERESLSAVSVVKSYKKINAKVWTNAHARLIRRAASFSQVARIFVHPPIKKALCDWSKGQKNRSWLRKVRPYYGHHYHFHIRINCPRGSTNCRNQPAARPKDGTGCGAELANWYKPRRWRPITKYKPKRAIRLSSLPAECRKVLNAK